MKKLIVLMLILCFVAVSAHGSYFTSFEASEGYTDDVTLNGITTNVCHLQDFRTHKVPYLLAGSSCHHRQGNLRR